MGKVYSMVIKYLDSKRIQTSAEGTYGSGGGSGGAVTSGNPTGTAGQGNSGGYGTGSNGNGGGGGGSSSAGTNGSLSSGVGSDGGSGTNNNWTTGSNVGYAGGGAGGHANNTGGSGTATHGAHAGAYPNNVADANSGAGGSAGDSMTENSQVYGGTGGSGIVVVRYLTSGAPTVVSSVTPSTVGSYTVHKFISTGSFQITSGSTSADILVVGGGGSGGTRRHGAGGGAGGYIETLSKSLGVDTYTITIGAGGASTQSTNNASGSDGTYSAFDDGGGDEIKAKGGGKGGGYNDAGGGGTSPATKPTNVQNNSVLVEKDTGKRYWFDDAFDLSELKSYWKFNEASGDIVNQATSVGSTDSLGTSADLQTSGVSYDETGIIDKSILYNGSSNTSIAGSSVSQFNFIRNTTATATIVFWYKQTALDGDNAFLTQVCNGAGGQVGMQIEKRNSSTNKRQLTINNYNGSNSVNTITSDTFFPADLNWHMLSIRFNYSASTMTCKIDDETPEVLSITQTWTDTNSCSAMKIGYWATSEFYGGNLDEFSIWNRILTDAEITTIYNSGTGKTLDTAKGATWTRQPPSFTASFWGAGGTAGPWTPVNYHDQFNGTTWSTATALSTSVQMVSGCGTKTAGLVIGGDTSGTSSPISTVQAWNGSAWSTSTGGTMNVARNQHASGGSSISAWAVAGRTSSSANNTTSFWDNSSWTSGATTSTDRRNHAGAGAVDDCWITGGYEDSTSTVLASTEQYNGTAWSAGGNLGTATNSIMGGGGDTYNAIITGGNEGSNSNKTNIYNGTAWSLGGTLTNAHKYGHTSGTPQDAGAYLGYVSSWTPTWSETYNGTSWTTQGSVSNGRATGAGGN